MSNSVFRESQSATIDLASLLSSGGDTDGVDPHALFTQRALLAMTAEAPGVLYVGTRTSQKRLTVRLGPDPGAWTLVALRAAIAEKRPVWASERRCLRAIVPLGTTSDDLSEMAVSIDSDEDVRFLLERHLHARQVIVDDLDEGIVEVSVNTRDIGGERLEADLVFRVDCAALVDGAGAFIHLVKSKTNEHLGERITRNNPITAWEFATERSKVPVSLTEEAIGDALADPDTTRIRVLYGLKNDRACSLAARKGRAYDEFGSGMIPGGGDGGMYC